MDYAGKLFAELGMFERFLLDSDDSVTIELDVQMSENLSDDGRQLLSKASAILGKVASWLRLRDEALLSMCQSLLCRMLKKFHQAGVDPEADALDVCQNMAIGTRKKYITNMTDQQKAELRIAVSLHRPLEAPEADLEPSVKVDTEVPAEPPSKRLKTTVIDLEAWAAKSRGVEATTDTGRDKSTKSNLPAGEKPSNKAEAAIKRGTKPPGGSNSALIKDIRAGVRSDIRARGIAPSVGAPKSITSTEGAKLKSLNALIIPQAEKQVKVVDEDDSSSSDDQEDIGNAVFAIPKAIKAVEKPKGPRRTEFIGGSTIFTRGIPLGNPGPKQAQSAADIRARLTPDLTPLFRGILNWNFFHDGDLPPNSAKTDYTMVTQSFRTPKEYAETFEPLLLLESWQQIVKAREEIQMSSAFDIKVVSRGPPGTGKTKTVIAVIGALIPDEKGVSISVPGGKATAPNTVTKKLLVCAPSNAAVDELVIRLKEGVVRQSGEKFIPTVVRLGRLDVINQAVHDVCLETLVEKKINFHNEKQDTANGKSGGQPRSLDELRTEMNALLSEKNGKQLALDHSRAEKREPPKSLRDEVDNLSRKIRDLGRQMDEVRDKSSMVKRNNDIRRREFMQQVLDEAHVICATLSGAGHDTLRNLNIEFETVIIDEAAQSIELSALIPLKFGCKKCIMVGDPKQLPPTVLSREASRFAYEQSLFVRMQKNHPESVHLLSIQYRMHPEISAFPSRVFYNSQLEDGPNMENLRMQPWHQSLFFGPYRFFNVLGQESTLGHSMKNTHEVEVALMIYKRLVADFPETNFDGKIGIITPYKTQLQALRQKFVNNFDDQILKTIDFNTTDAFQGREREIIIFSCVRASQKSTVGFLSDIRRMNVGLTRARSSLFVLGNAETLSKNEFWSQLVEDARGRDRYTEGNFGQLLKRPCRMTIKQIEKRFSGVSISPPTSAYPKSAADNMSSPTTGDLLTPMDEEDDWLREPVASKNSNEPDNNAIASTKLSNNDGLKKRQHEEATSNASPVSGREKSDVLAIASPAATPQSQPLNRPQRPLPGSRGPLPPKKKKKNVEDAMFIRRKPQPPPRP
ncbi:hypothetical protein ABW19_dt0208095 [Dactylella cylindrospora]|nr:hypothetical protein ABW19_dt0208095 [Dactylella cylindrospora]